MCPSTPALELLSGQTHRVDDAENLRKPRPSLWARAVKRPLEATLAAGCLLVCGPLILLAMALARVSDRGPALFLQTRTGRFGENFLLVKLRTMTAGRAIDPLEVVGHDHPAVTTLGRLLRRFKIDELPQLVSVLRGKMSFVGPRPPLPTQAESYDEFQRQRLLVRPGLTGLAQVNGNAAISWDERIKYDVHYVRHHGVLMDVGIVLKSLLVVLCGEQQFARPFEQSPYGRRKTENKSQNI